MKGGRLRGKKTQISPKWTCAQTRRAGLVEAPLFNFFVNITAFPPPQDLLTLALSQLQRPKFANVKSFSVPRAPINFFLLAVSVAVWIPSSLVFFPLSLSLLCFPWPIPAALFLLLLLFSQSGVMKSESLLKRSLLKTRGRAARSRDC